MALTKGKRAMQPRITVITIGVDSLEKSVAFYRDGLGLSTQGIIGTEFEHGSVAFFELQAGVRLAVWPRTSIAHDTGMPVEPPSATEFTLGHNVASKEEVDTIMAQALSSPHRKRFGVATPAISKTLTAICGRLSGIRNWI
jgi:catechol 2,3-dioxygenase-like lactoylglutathione lyase family enzyme